MTLLIDIENYFNREANFVMDNIRTEVLKGEGAEY